MFMCGRRFTTLLLVTLLGPLGTQVLRFRMPKSKSDWTEDHPLSFAFCLWMACSGMILVIVKATFACFWLLPLAPLNWMDAEDEGLRHFGKS